MYPENSPHISETLLVSQKLAKALPSVVTDPHFTNETQPPRPPRSDLIAELSVFAGIDLFFREAPCGKEYGLANGHVAAGEVASLTGGPAGGEIRELKQVVGDCNRMPGECIQYGAPDHLGAVFQSCYRAREPSGLCHTVGVDEGDVFSAGLGDTQVSRRPCQ
jgi:hypothetical protein